MIGWYKFISAVFSTWFVFTAKKKKTDPAPPNRVRWNLEKEG